jgi:hypothetical protein
MAGGKENHEPPLKGVTAPSLTLRYFLYCSGG